MGFSKSAATENHAFFGFLKKVEFESAFTRPVDLASLDVFDYIKLVTIEPDATITWVTSVSGCLKTPQTELEFGCRCDKCY